MRIVFFTHIYFGDIKWWMERSKKLPGIAISNYEKGFVNSLLLYENNEIVLINRPFLSQKTTIDYSEVENVSKTFHNNIINTPFFEGKNQNANFAKYIVKDPRIRKSIETSDVVLFSTYHDFRIYRFIRKVNPFCRLFLFLPDLPHFVVNKVSFFHKIRRKIEAMRFMNACNHLDGLFPITDSIGEFMKRKVKNYLPLQGVVKEEDISKYQREINKKIIVYSGGLAKKYGVLDLIDAFLESPLCSGYKLHIFGKGECGEIIDNLAKTHHNIVFYGFVPREMVLRDIEMASFLIVPENPINDYSKYSFHSKILECMASGVPTLTYFYGGIPSCYHNYLLEISSGGKDTKTDIANSFEKYLKISFSDNISFGNAARSFVSKNNSPYRIGRDIISFISVTTKE